MCNILALLVILSLNFTWLRLVCNDVPGNGSEIGAAFIYTKENISNEWSNNLDSLSLSPSLIENRQMLSSWQLKYSTVSLAGSQSFWGWGVGIGANNFGIGAFGFGKIVPY